MAWEIAPGVYDIHQCSLKTAKRENFQEDGPDWYKKGEEVHNPVRAYLFTRGEKNFLFDTIAPSRKDYMIDELQSILDGEPLHYIVVSHTEPPHGGNAIAIQRAFPEAELIAPADINHHDTHQLYYLDEARLVEDGDTIDLGDGYTIEFVKAVLMDGPTIWAFERNTRTLFSSDGFGALHNESECERCLDELDDISFESRAYHFHVRPMFWFAYVDVDKTFAAIESMIEELDPALVLPTHGAPIRKDAQEYLRKMRAVIQRCVNEGKDIPRGWGEAD